MKRPKIGIILVIVVAVLMSVVSTASLAADPVEISLLWWAGEADDPNARLELSLIEYFEELHPNIKVNIVFADWNSILDRTVTLHAAGLAPDVLWVREGHAYDLAKMGLLADLERFISRDPDFDPDNFLPGVYDSAKVDGVQYALHRDVWAPSIFYNVSWFQQVGLADPQPGWTFDDLLETAQKLTDPTRNKFGMGNIESRNTIIYSFGGRVMNEDKTAFTLHEPAALEAIAYMHSFPWVYHVQPQPGELPDWHEPQWVRGDVAMQYWGPWAWPGYHDVVEFEWDVAPPVHGPAGAATHLDGLLLAISSATKHPDEAWQLLRFLAYDVRGQTEFVRKGMGSPTVRYPETLRALLESENAPRTVQNYVEALMSGRPDIPRLPQRVHDVFDETFSAIMSNSVDIAPAIQEAERRALAILEELAQQRL